MYCKQCGAAIDQDARYCTECGAKVQETKQYKDPFAPEGSYEVPSPIRSKQSNLGLMSFILAMVSLFLPIPYLDVAIALIAVIMALYVISKEERKGFAIAGLILGFLGLIVGYLYSFTDFYDEIFEQLSIIIRLF